MASGRQPSSMIGKGCISNGQQGQGLAILASFSSFLLFKKKKYLIF